MTETAEKTKVDISKATPRPWGWVIHDHSMASLGVLPDPGLGDDLVMSVGPCSACADRAEPKEWKWGRCTTPSEADAALIVRAVNHHDELVQALRSMRALAKDEGEATLLNICAALNSIIEEVVDPLLAKLES